MAMLEPSEETFFRDKITHSPSLHPIFDDVTDAILLLLGGIHSKTVGFGGLAGAFRLFGPYESRGERPEVVSRFLNGGHVSRLENVLVRYGELRGPP